jgi:type II secretory pathway component PulF
MKALLEFTEMMETLLSSGLSVRDALEALVLMDSASKSASLGRELLEHIRRGSSFAQAVEQSDADFPLIYRGMIAVGDAAGSVERIFPRLSAYLRNRKKLADKTAAALAYPALVLSAAFAGTLGLVFYVMPKMERVFSGFGEEAGLRLRENMRTMEGMFTAVLTVCAGLTFTVLSLGLYRKTNTDAAQSIDRCILSVPLLGRFIASWETLNFSFAMEVLSGGGMRVEDAIREAAAMVSNRDYRQSLGAVREKVLGGYSLSAAFGEEKFFPPALSRWISIGEQAGKTEQVFTQIRSFFQDEIEQRTSKFLLLIEPAMIGLIGLVLLALTGSILLPLFSIYGTIL